MSIINNFLEISKISKAYCAEILGVSNSKMYTLIRSETDDITIHQYNIMINYLKKNNIRYKITIGSIGNPFKLCLSAGENESI